MSNLKTYLALLVTVFVLVAVALLITFMLSDVDADDETWKRYVYLLTGVEAIVFAAVGWLFGKEVHREHAETAEQKRNEAEETARRETERAAGEAEKGRGLARAMIAAGGGPDEISEAAGAPGQPGPRAPQSAVIDSLVRQARRAYPDV